MAEHFNSSGVIIKIDNNVQKAPTTWAEEAVERIMKNIIFHNPAADTNVQIQMMAYRASLERMIFDIVADVTRKAITAERLKLGDKSDGNHKCN